MQCLIVGTSNSMLAAGYRPFLERLMPEGRFDRFTLGATPSVLLPYAMAQLSLDGVDTVVIDTLVNDANHVASGSAGLAWCDTVLEESLGRLQALGKRAVLLLMPQTDAADVARRLRAHRLARARALGVEVLDGYAVVDALRLQLGLTEEQVFRDASHVAPPAALIIAQRLAALLRAPPPTPRAVVSPAAFPYAFVPFAAEPARQVTRGTSLIERRYVALGADEPQAITFAAPVAVVALAVNAATTSCLLEMRSECGVATKDLRLAPKAQTGRTMQHQLIAFADPPQGQAFVVIPRAASGDAPADAAVERSRPVQPAANLGRAELEGVLVRFLDPPPGRFRSRPPEAEAALPAPLLTAEEACIGGLAALLPTPGRVARAATIFRERLASSRPVWRRPAPHAAAPLAALGVELGEREAARRVLAAALEEAPGAGFLARRLEALDGEGTEPPETTTP